jgi:hypothetical protein
MNGAALASDNFVAFSAVFLPILFDDNNEETLHEGYAHGGWNNKRVNVTNFSR